METPPAPVLKAISSYPEAAQKDFYQLRRLVYETAARLSDLGPITETTKWGEPAFLTEVCKSGTTIRIAWNQKYPEKIGLYVNCKTSLIDSMRGLFANEFEFQGNRGILMRFSTWDKQCVAQCMEMALTYHRRPKKLS